MTHHLRKHPAGQKSIPVVLGALLAAATLTLIVGGLVEGSDHHWAAWTQVITAAGCTAGGLLYLQQHRAARTGRAMLVDSAVTTLRTFRVGLGMSLLLRVVLGGILISVTLVLQNGLDYSPLRAGLSVLPMTFGMIVGVAALAEILVPRLGRRIFPVGAAILLAGLAAAVIVLQRAQSAATVWQLSGPLAVFGVGLGTIIGPLFAVTLQDVSTGHVGSASGALEAVEQLGGSLGVVVMTSILFHHTPHNSLPSGFTWVALACAVPVLASAALAVHLPHWFRTEDDLHLNAE